MKLESLKALNAFIVWKYEQRGGKTTKVPYCGVEGHPVGTSEEYRPRWTTYAKAQATYKFNKRGFDGVGFVGVVKEHELFPAWVYYDSYSARYFVEEMQTQGFNMVRCIQGAKTLSLPMQMLGQDLKAHKVIYNNNPILKWCLTNTGVVHDRNGNIVPVKNQSPRQRIDGTAALLDCYVGLYEHYTEFTGAI